MADKVTDTDMNPIDSGMPTCRRATAAAELSSMATGPARARLSRPN